MSKTLKTVLGIAFLLAAYGFAGANGYEEALRQEAEYCDSVYHGKWPDYRGDYRQTCVNGIPKQ